MSMDVDGHQFESHSLRQPNSSKINYLNYREWEFYAIGTVLNLYF